MGGSTWVLRRFGRQGDLSGGFYTAVRIDQPAGRLCRVFRLHSIAFFNEVEYWAVGWDFLACRRLAHGVIVAGRHTYYAVRNKLQMVMIWL